MWGINKHCDRIYWFFIRAFLLKLLKILAFIISKFYFINFNIPLYNIPNIKNFIFFITLLKYYYYYYYFFFLILNLSLPLSSSMLRVCLLSNPLPQPPPPTCLFVFPCLFLSFLPKQHEIHVWQRFSRETDRKLLNQLATYQYKFTKGTHWVTVIGPLQSWKFHRCP